MAPLCKVPAGLRRATRFAHADDGWECTNDFDAGAAAPLHAPFCGTSGATLRMCPRSRPTCAGYVPFQSYGACTGAPLCAPCPAGSYCPAGASAPVACPPGTSSAAGSGDLADCQ